MKIKLCIIALTFFSFCSSSLCAQLDIVKKGIFKVKMKMHNDSSDTLKLLNPCSYYYLRKDYLLVADKRFIRQGEDAIWIDPPYQFKALLSMIGKNNFRIIELAPGDSLNFSLYTGKLKIGKKQLKIGYYLYENGTLKLNYAD